MSLSRVAVLIVLMVAGAAQMFSQMVRTGRQVMIPLYGADVVGLDVEAITGMTYNPFTKVYSLVRDSSVNYIMAYRA